MRVKKSISLFFLFCLLNVALIPQLCLNAVQAFNYEFSGSALSDEESKDFGIKIFEEESKEGHDENKTGTENLLKIIKSISNNSLPGLLHSLNSKIHFKLYLNGYGSVKLTPLSPPPDQI